MVLIRPSKNGADIDKINYTVYTIILFMVHTQLNDNINVTKI